MKKKITAVMLVVLMGAMLFTGLTLAYFTDSDEAENVFTYGQVDIELIEEGWDANKAQQGVFPGESYDKKPYVKNGGNNDAYVRIGVKVNGAKLKAINSKDANYNITDDTLLKNLVDLQEGWTFDKAVTDDNGDCTFWYNYGSNGILAPTATTSALFTKVTIPAKLTYDQVEANSEFKLTVIAQAVQTATFSSASEAFNAAF